MIETLYSLDGLDTRTAWVLALLIGAAFGFALERAGFSSSRRLAGVFYFTDMAVVKVMFSAVITAMLGLSIMIAFGWIARDSVFLMPTIYGAQILGGLLFGVGFVMGGWCPGTAVAGLAAGRIDALVFLLGAVGGSILFNEAFPFIGRLYMAGDRGVVMVYDSVGLSRHVFAAMFAVVGVGAFWASEWAEKKRTGKSAYLGSRFLKAFSVALLLAAGVVFMLGQPGGPDAVEMAIMHEAESGADHMDADELADRLMAGEDMFLADIRPQSEFDGFHIRGAVNVSMAGLADAVRASGKSKVVLYSNGMTHPAQARDSLRRQGFDNVFILTDGLTGFVERCLKPVSLRSEPVPAAEAGRIRAWRGYFGAAVAGEATTGSTVGADADDVSVLVDVWRLAGMLGGAGVKVLDLRPQPEYNTAHIPGSLSLNVESLRGNTGGVPSMLLPARMLAAQFSLLGIEATDRVILVTGDKFHDATLAALAFERVGHRGYAVLNGGYAAWAAAGLPTDARLPSVAPSMYEPAPDADTFSVARDLVAAESGRRAAVILDVRPSDYFSGAKTDEARAGHIPGAVNRPFSEDTVSGTDKSVSFRPVDELSAAYGKIIRSLDTPVIVHCRTGHQASQTYFILKHLLGYRNVRWYDGGWTDWSSREELPVETGAAAGN